MEHKDNKFKLDLDFLDKDASEANSNKLVYQNKTEETKRSPYKPFRHMSDGAKKWLIGIAIVGAILSFGVFSDDSSSTTSTSNSTVATDDGLIQTGQYRCSQYHHSKAGELEPSTTDDATLDSKTAQLASESDRMDSEKYQIENEYVDEYNQWSIDQHNEKIDDYNSRLQSYRYREQSHEADIDSYNAQVETYNNYLVANCTRAH